MSNPDYESKYGKKVEGILYYSCHEHPEKYIELIKFGDGTQKITCDLFRKQDCDHSCVYGNLYRGLMY